MKSLTSLFLLCSIALLSCKKEDSQAEKDEATITQYIADKGLSAKAVGNGLYVVTEVEGTGDKPTLADDVTVFYKGYLTAGGVFDSTGTEPATFPLTAVIEGWQQGIPQFKEGGKGTILIPSALGYGSRQAGSIPANSVLIFDIELVAVN